MPKKREQLFPERNQGQQPQKPPCQYPSGCPNGANHRIRIAGTIKTGHRWASVCDDHYVWASTMHLMRHLDTR